MLNFAIGFCGFAPMIAIAGGGNELMVALIRLPCLSTAATAILFKRLALGNRALCRGDIKVSPVSTIGMAT